MLDKCPTKKFQKKNPWTVYKYCFCVQKGTKFKLWASTSQKPSSKLRFCLTLSHYGKLHYFLELSDRFPRKLHAFIICLHSAHNNIISDELIKEELLIKEGQANTQGRRFDFDIGGDIIADNNLLLHLWSTFDHSFMSSKVFIYSYGS